MELAFKLATGWLDQSPPAEVAQVASLKDPNAHAVLAIMRANQLEEPQLVSFMPFSAADDPIGCLGRFLGSIPELVSMFGDELTDEVSLVFCNFKPKRWETRPSPAAMKLPAAQAIVWFCQAVAESLTPQNLASASDWVMLSASRFAATRGRTSRGRSWGVVADTVYNSRSNAFSRFWHTLASASRHDVMRWERADLPRSLRLEAVFL
jgi:hypothetical protein